MDYSQTVLFSDLDGTLFNSAGKVSPENIAAIERYMAQGGKFAISTGRQPDNARTFWPDPVTNAPSVVLNGAAVYDFNTGEYDHCVYLDRAPFWQTIHRLMAEIPPIDIQLYLLPGIRYITPPENAQPQLLMLHRPCSWLTLEEAETMDVFKTVMYVPPEWEARLRELLAPGDGRDYRLVPGTTDVGGIITYYELLPTLASKGTAIDALRSHADLRGRTFFAVGDDWHDYEMLRAADIAVAPANAIDEIKAVCRYTTVSNNDHAIAHIIDELIPSL